MVLAQQLTALRRSRKLTMSELADRLEISPSAVSRWETGLFQPRLQILVRLMRELNASPKTRARVFQAAERLDAWRAFELPEPAPEETCFGDLLRGLRLRSEMSAKSVAAQLEVNPSMIARWESGDDLPSADMRIRLSEIFPTPDACVLIRTPTDIESLCQSLWRMRNPPEFAEVLSASSQQEENARMLRLLTALQAIGLRARVDSKWMNLYLLVTQEYFEGLMRLFRTEEFVHRSRAMSNFLPRRLPANGVTEWLLISRFVAEGRPRRGKTVNRTPWSTIRALRDMSEAMSQGGANGWGFVTAAGLAADSGKSTAALSLLQQVRLVLPGEVLFGSMGSVVAHYYRLAGKPKEALSLLEQCVSRGELQGANPIAQIRLLFQLAITHAAMGQRPDGYDFVAQAEALRRRSETPANALSFQMAFEAASHERKVFDI